MFGKLKEKLGLGGDDGLAVGAPVEGQAVPLSEVSDPTFGQEILGKGAAIRPSKGRVVSPVDGTVETMFDTGHAVSLRAAAGTEILIHVGLDTVKLGGEHFTIHAKNGDQVKKGDLLMEFDIAGITGAGYDIITPVVICNTSDYADVSAVTGSPVAELDPLIRLKK
ncbi:PTS sugar transporter subunit IIA [Intestinibacillus massiliensis]|uniref:PTS sugar transporter subunit IIA n=1 Tax=Intestinibacillus massiliensis TaxID=1871029 RepID=UPI000B351024|nr:PTS glucose transporter subunit IIA [Intestinibacillus massiliensis]